MMSLLKLLTLPIWGPIWLIGKMITTVLYFFVGRNVMGGNQKR